ncbi:MAG: LPS biosynthesis protein WbpP, partial [Verrucomicrobia bacterium]|nr:LPS biosynthesis protein WbpP [Verrucomicrobiota bacterium]
YSGVISKFTDDIKNGRTPTIFGDGLQTRDFVFVKDVVQANLLAMHSDEAGHGEAFNVGTGRSVNLLELLGILGELTGKNIDPILKPARAGDIRHSLSDISAIKTELAYAPAFTLKQGLAELLKWMGMQA